MMMVKDIPGWLVNKFGNMEFSIYSLQPSEHMPLSHSQYVAKERDFPGSPITGDKATLSILYYAKKGPSRREKGRKMKREKDRQILGAIKKKTRGN